MKAILVVVSFLFTTSVWAQTTDETAVKAVISQLFESMKKADSTALKSVFMVDAKLQTVLNRQNDVSVRSESIGKFVTSVGSAKAGALDERLSGMDIRVDGDLATAWTPYAFYYNGQPSHCGANAFTLVRIGGNWKIQNIIDTRRKCP